MNLAPLAWLAFIAATVIFVLLALNTIPAGLAVPSAGWWGLALVSFGLAFSGYWESRRTPAG